MGKSQRLVLIILIILIILIVIIGIFMKKINKEKQFFEYAQVDEVNLEETLQSVETRTNYYTVKKCTDKFYLYYMTSFNIEEYYYQESDPEKLKEAEVQNASVLYNMLDKEYIQAEQVTSDNIKTMLSDIKPSTVNITSMYISQKDYNMAIYLVKGILIEKETNNKTQFEIIVKLDLSNQTFSILPQEYVKQNYNNLEIGKEIEINVSERINGNKNNTYKYNVIDDETYLKDLFSKLNSEIKYSIEIVYNNLNEEYRNKKFGTIEEFKKYLESNSARYSGIQVEKYQKEAGENYTRYVCTDKNGNYYIFTETAVMDYTLILDTYTVDLPEFIEKYEGATEQQKVAYNIDKFIKALNDSDYKYAYNCLADSYKNNYFKTQQEFETYAKETFFGCNVEYKQFNIEGELYTYSVILTNEETGEKMNKTFIMQLGEGTEFVLSFNK